MMNYGVSEKMPTEPMYAGEEVCNPRRESNIAAYADHTARALKEANMALDKLFDNVFGPCPTAVNEKPVPPVVSLEQQMAQNAEIAMVIANRVCELMARMFG